MKLFTPSNSYKNIYEDNEPKKSIQIVLKIEMGETMIDIVPFLNYNIDWSIKYWTKTDIVFLVYMLMITLKAKCFRYYRDNIMTYINVNQIYDLSIFLILNSFNYFIFCFQYLPKT